MKGMLSAVALVLVLAARGSAAGSSISVSDAWSRPAVGTAVVYATIRNDGPLPDRLVGATSPIATHVGLHESFAMHGGSAMGNMPMMGGGSMIGMKPVPFIAVPAHGSTTLKPGGYHLMLDLRHDVGAGARIPLRLHFARAGWIATTVPVEAMH